MFGEQTREWSPKDGMELQVVLSPKYIQTRANAMEIIQKHTYLSEEDFWILKHVTRAKKMQYDGLIITHLACLKINDHLPEEKRLIPSCVSVNQCGYDNSLVYTYANDKQGIYEVGEVSPRNCQNPYVYAMAYKRLFDRVVLKLSKIAFSGILSDSEVGAEDIQEREEADRKSKKDLDKAQHELSAAINHYCEVKQAERREIVRKILKERGVKMIGSSIEACRIEIELLKKWLAEDGNPA